jgi:hypothetical protein
MRKNSLLTFGFRFKKNARRININGSLDDCERNTAYLKGRRSIEGSLDIEYFGPEATLGANLIFEKQKQTSISSILKESMKEDEFKLRPLYTINNEGYSCSEEKVTTGSSGEDRKSSPIKRKISNNNTRKIKIAYKNKSNAKSQFKTCYLETEVPEQKKRKSKPRMFRRSSDFSKDTKRLDIKDL